MASVALGGANGADIVIENSDQFSTYFDKTNDSAILKQAHKTDNIYLRTNPAWHTDKDKPITSNGAITTRYDHSFSRVKIEANKLILDDTLTNATTPTMTIVSDSEYQGNLYINKNLSVINVENLVTYKPKVRGFDLLVESKASDTYAKILEVERNFRQQRFWQWHF
ncbi:hypothetical protein ACRE1S_06095 [Helicobacter himalayensis]|uniref:hypothetical protein n=1 Tax=Helicobacter himalayensis TaxID=1591088 RepID=UPI003D6E9396